MKHPSLYWTIRGGGSPHHLDSRPDGPSQPQHGDRFHTGTSDDAKLFGLGKQMIGVLTGLAIITLATTGFLNWRRRQPNGGLGQ